MNKKEEILEILFDAIKTLSEVEQCTSYSDLLYYAQYAHKNLIEFFKGYDPEILVKYEAHFRNIELDEEREELEEELESADRDFDIIVETFQNTNDIDAKDLRELNYIYDSIKDTYIKLKKDPDPKYKKNVDFYNEQKIIEDSVLKDIHSQRKLAEEKLKDNNDKK